MNNLLGQRPITAWLRLNWRGLQLMAEGSPDAIVWYVLLMVLMGLMPIAQAWLMKLVIDDLVGGSRSPLVFHTTLYIATLVASAGFEPIQQSLSALLRDRAVGAVDRALMRAGVRMTDLYRIERPSFSDELRLQTNVTFQIPDLLMGFQTLCSALISLTGLLLLLGSLNPLLPLALIVLSVPQLAIERRSAELMFAAMRDCSRAGREIDYCVRVTTEPAAAKEIRVFNIGDFFLQRFQTQLATALAEVRRVRLAHLGKSILVAGLQAIALSGGLWYVAVRAGTRSLAIGELAMSMNAMIQIQSSLMWLSRWLGAMHQAQLHLKSFFDFLDNAASKIALPAQGYGLDVPSTLQSGVAFCNVSFTYPDSHGLVLDNLSFNLPAGKITALVGINGAGKSTIVKLLTRMYDPEQGQILIDGIPIQKYAHESLRRRIAVVYQDFAHFALTLRDNIALGDLRAASLDRCVEQAAVWAGADPIAAKLPSGYNTELTRRFQGGIDLSGGEWQKVALARSFMRDAALIILDEPTSALDAYAEEHLFIRFRGLAHNKTTLIISHRLSTVRMADQIAVLESGRVVEVGSHAELLRQASRYAKLYKMQAEKYYES